MYIGAIGVLLKDETQHDELLSILETLQELVPRRNADVIDNDVTEDDINNDDHDSASASTTV